jgi:thiamine biosynthesis lipoprotein
MSVSIGASDVMQINAAAGQAPVQVSEPTLLVIEKAIYYSQISNGYFDITMGPLSDLWQIGTPEAHVPEASEIQIALEHVDYRKITIQGLTVGLNEEGMKMDLGAIVKGYAADVVAEMAKQAGVTSGIVNLGGNVRVIGSKTDGSAYKIGVQNPFLDRNTYFGVVQIIDQTVVTSGNYERYFEVDGKRYHHILDKDTGYPTDNSIAAVTVVTSESIDADALSTTLYTLGRQAGIALVNTLDNVSCIYVTKDQEIYLSQGMKELFELTDNSFTIMDEPK